MVWSSELQFSFVSDPRHVCQPSKESDGRASSAGAASLVPRWAESGMAGRSVPALPLRKLAGWVFIPSFPGTLLCLLGLVSPPLFLV